jgi:hypothetical protein
MRLYYTTVRLDNDMLPIKVHSYFDILDMHINAGIVEVATDDNVRFTIRFTAGYIFTSVHPLYTTNAYIAYSTPELADESATAEFKAKLLHAINLLGN